MRISDWSSDVCSSDLRSVNTTTQTSGSSRSQRRLGVDTHQLTDRLIVAGVGNSGLLEMERNQKSRMPSDTSGVGRERVPARLQVRLLGAVEIILDGRRLRAFNSLRLQRFLALIVLRRDPQNRSRLAFELWPDSADRQAPTNPRQLLHDFRHSLPPIGTFAPIHTKTARKTAG